MIAITSPARASLFKGRMDNSYKPVPALSRPAGVRSARAAPVMVRAQEPSSSSERISGDEPLSDPSRTAGKEMAEPQSGDNPEERGRAAEQADEAARQPMGDREADLESGDKASGQEGPQSGASRAGTVAPAAAPGGITGGGEGASTEEPREGQPGAGVPNAVELGKAAGEAMRGAREEAGGVEPAQPSERYPEPT